MGGLANRMSVFDSLQPEQNRRDTLPERTMADVLALPEDLCTIMDYLIEQGESELAEVSAHIGQEETSTRTLLVDLIEKGFVQEMLTGSQHRYRVRLVSRRRNQLPLDLCKGLNRKDDFDYVFSPCPIFSHISPQYL